MSDSMTEWIAAYFDGELSSERRAWVEDHLAVCADCRRELDDLHALSGLLQSVPVPAGRLSEEAFNHQVLRRLPPAHIPFWNKALRGGLRYAPLGLFGLWAFSQAVVVVSGAVLLLLGLFPPANGVLQALSPASEAAEASLFSLLFQAGTFISLPAYTNVFEWIEWFSPLIFVELALLVVFAGMFLSWFAGYWSLHRLQAAESSE